MSLFDRVVIILAACQQSNFLSFVFTFVLNLVDIKGVRFLSETIEGGRLEYQCSTWKACGPLQKNTAYNSSRNHLSSGHIIFPWKHIFVLGFVCLKEHDWFPSRVQSFRSLFPRASIENKFTAKVWQTSSKYHGTNGRVIQEAVTIFCFKLFQNMCWQAYLSCLLAFNKRSTWGAVTVCHLKEKISIWTQFLFPLHVLSFSDL